MPPLLAVIIAVVALLVIGAIVTMLVRRRRAAGIASLEAASAPLPDLSEDDIAWRIGVAGLARPVHAPVEAAEGEPAIAAATRPSAAPSIVAAGPAAPPPAPVAVPAPVVLSPSAPPQPLPASLPAHAPLPPRVFMTPALPRPVPAPALVPLAPPEPPVPISRRRLLWRDSAAVLMVACLAVAVLWTVQPGLAPRPVAFSAPTDMAVLDAQAATPRPPTAAFSYRCSGRAIRFVATPVADGGYGWDFGDGSTASDRTPSHTFDADGAYTVVLTVASSGGTDIASHEVTVPCSENP